MTSSFVREPPRAPGNIGFSPAICVTLLLTAGCSTSAAGGGGGYPALPQGSAGAADSACDPALQVEGCHGQERMLCDNGTKTWQLLDECASPKRCAENGVAEAPGAFITLCEDPPPPTADGGSLDGGSPVAGCPGGCAGPDTAESVCARWKADRVELGEGTFSGNLAACDPGEVSASAKDNAVKLVNLYRWLVRLPPVTRDAANDAKAQQCALMMAANGKLSHTPPNTWKCWTEDGALAAKRSNISTAPGVTSVDRYMIDSGAHNRATLGHRRWILSNSLGPIGVGSTATKSSCLWVIGGSGKGAAAWTSWPPAGKVPVKAFAPYGKESIDQTGWSIQSDSIPFQKAQIRVVDQDGNERKVEQWQLGGGYGSKYAVAFAPVGWAVAGGTTYTVHVNGIAKPFSYQVEVLDCP